MSDDIMGVNEGEPDSPLFGGTEVSTPETNEQEGQTAVKEEVKEVEAKESTEVAPKKDLEHNIQAIRKQLVQLRQENESLKNNPLEKALRQNPDFFQLIHSWLTDPKRVNEAQLKQVFKDAFQQTPAKDPLEGYEPEVAERFRKIDQLEQALKEREAREQQERMTYQQQLEAQHVKTLESVYYKEVEARFKDMPPEGHFLVASSVKQILEDALGDVNKANEEQVKMAVDHALKTFDVVSKYSLGKVKNVTVPASGSAQGIVPAQGKPKGAEGRISTFADLL